jgi:hypothetical protein
MLLGFDPVGKRPADGRMLIEETPLTEIETPEADEDEEKNKKYDEERHQHYLVIEAMRYAWQDLVFHAEQRTIHMRFYLLVSGALTAGFGQAFLSKQYIFAVLLAALGCVVAPVFYIMDVRDGLNGSASELIARQLEHKLAGWLNIPDCGLGKRNRKRSFKLLYAFGAQYLFAPTRMLILLGCGISIVALECGLLKSYDVLCKPSVMHGSKVEVDFCRSFIFNRQIFDTLSKLSPDLDSKIENNRKRQ